MDLAETLRHMAAASDAVRSADGHLAVVRDGMLTRDELDAVRVGIIRAYDAEARLGPVT